jgi:hypothetical protein
MPRRAGARRGVISEQLRRALLHEGGELAGRPDPVEQVKAIYDFHAELDYELEPIADARLAAVAELRRQGWSYDRIAAATELS